MVVGFLNSRSCFECSSCDLDFVSTLLSRARSGLHGGGPVKNQLSKILLHVVLPLAVGGLAYCLWRPDTLLLFHWLAYLGVSEVLTAPRSLMSNASGWLPDVVVYSIPAGLWMYSVASCLHLIWARNRGSSAFAWSFACLLFGIGSEVAQATKLIPGTAALADASVYFFAWALSFLIFLMGGFGEETSIVVVRHWHRLRVCSWNE